MIGKDIIKAILDADAVNAVIEIYLSDKDALVLNGVEVVRRDNGAPTVATFKVLKATRRR